MAFEASPWYKSTCNVCKCVEGGSPCSICICFKFKCRGTCLCCEDYRKTLPSTSQGLGHSSVPKEDAERICDQCNCLKNRKSCRKCVRGSYKCTGTCLCCYSSQKTEITVGEKDLKDITIYVPSETINTVSGASTQTDSPPQKKIQIRKPPSRPASKLTVKKSRRIQCLQCFCEADKVPCEICCFKDVRCRGSCPCCKIKSIYRFLNPRDSDMFEPICPRCTRTPGEGICDHCRKVADESAAALDRCRPKRGRRPKPAILTHKKKVKGDAVKGDQAKDVEPPTESKEKEETPLVFVPNDLHLLNQSYVKDEYCLNCQCRRGQEPCDDCIDSPCYGECECEECVDFNKQLLNDSLENLPENREDKEEQVKTPNTGAVIKKRSSSTKRRSKLVKTVDCEASTSKTTDNRLYSESLKCEQCDCVKYCRPCEDCSDMDMGCTFPVDDKLCLCCSIKFVF